MVECVKCNEKCNDICLPCDIHWRCKKCKWCWACKYEGYYIKGDTIFFTDKIGVVRRSEDINKRYSKAAIKEIKSSGYLYL